MAGFGERSHVADVEARVRRALEPEQRQALGQRLGRELGGGDQGHLDPALGQVVARELRTAM